MAAPWYAARITNPHSSDDGIDLGTPDNTDLTMPYAGTVIDTSYHDYGGQIVVHTGDGFDEYFIHANKIYVKPGDHVTPNEIVGTSGGGIGDLLLHDGVVEPAQAQSWFDGHSSGYHTEYGEFDDSSAAGSMSQFNQGWGNKSRQVDPTVTIAELNTKGPISGLTLPSGSQLASAASSIAQLTQPQQWASGIATALGFSSPQNALQRVAVGAAGVAGILIGVFVALQPEAQTVVETTAKAAKVAGAAAL